MVTRVASKNSSLIISDTRHRDAKSSNLRAKKWNAEVQLKDDGNPVEIRRKSTGNPKAGLGQKEKLNIQDMVQVAEVACEVYFYTFLSLDFHWNSNENPVFFLTFSLRFPYVFYVNPTFSNIFSKKFRWKSSGIPLNF